MLFTVPVNSQSALSDPGSVAFTCVWGTCSADPELQTHVWGMRHRHLWREDYEISVEFGDPRSAVYGAPNLPSICLEKGQADGLRFAHGSTVSRRLLRSSGRVKACRSGGFAISQSLANGRFLIWRDHLRGFLAPCFSGTLFTCRGGFGWCF